MAFTDSHKTSLELEDYLLLAAVVLLPWAFGGVEIWAFRSAALLLVSGACVALVRRGPSALGLSRGSGWLLPAFLLAGWAALQLVPLPAPVLGLISPTAHEVYASAFPGYDGPAPASTLAAMEAEALEAVPEAAAHSPAASPGPPVELPAPACLERRWRPISLKPSATEERLAWYVALLLGFLVVRERVGDSERFRLYRWTLFGLFGALALFALVQMQFWNGRIYWIRRVLVNAQPFGPYYNPTNLAGVMEIGVPAMAGLAWSRLRLRGRAALYEPGFGVSAVAAATCLVAGLASASKFAALMLAVAVLALGLLGARNLRDRVIVCSVTLLLTVVTGFVMSGTRLGERLEMFLGRTDHAVLLEGRLAVWQSGIEMFRDFPLTGTGFGSFRDVFQRYVPAGTANRWAQAHNDYLEVLLDGGLVAAVLVAWLAWGYARSAARELRGRNHLSPARIGLAIGVVALALHAVLDFNHQIPANALIWVAACAMLAPLRRVEQGSRT
jgi:hypothetical protein